MGSQSMSCSTISLPEKVAFLTALGISGNLIALLGESGTVLGTGTVEDVNNATVLLELSVLGVVTAQFFVDLCCVCSIVVTPLGGTIADLNEILGGLGIVIPPLAT